MEAVSSFAQMFAEYGPGWLIAGALIAVGIYVIHRLLNIYEKLSSDKVSTQREMTKISGQMVDQMDRSNTVLEAVQKELTLMNASNERLINNMAKDHERSAFIEGSVKKLIDRIETLYDKIVVEHS